MSSVPLSWMPAGVSPASTALPPVVHDAEELRDRARDLLSRAPYDDGSDGPLTALWERLRRFLADLVEALTGAVAASPTIAWAVVVVGSLVLVAVVVRATRGTTLDHHGASGTRRDVTRTAGWWHAEADRLEAAGDLRAAVRCRYGALVASLAERGVLVARADRTVHELDTEVAAVDPDAARVIAAAGGCYEEVLFGGRDAHAHDLAVLAEGAAVAARLQRRPAPADTPPTNDALAEVGR